MKRLINVTCRLKDADEVIGKLIPKDKSTSDLAVTIPVEIDDDPKAYNTLSSEKVLGWEFVKEDEKEVEETKTHNFIVENVGSSLVRDQIAKTFIFTSIGDFYYFLVIFCKIYCNFPSLIPFTKTWEEKYYFFKSTENRSDKVSISQEEITEIMTFLPFIRENLKIIMEDVFNYLRKFDENKRKANLEKEDRNPYSYVSRAIRYILDNYV